jgi:hypothetical protein
VRQTKAAHFASLYSLQSKFCESAQKEGKTMKAIKFLVKVNRGGIRIPQYVHRIDRAPIQMTTDRKQALVMGRLTAEDAVKSIQTSRRAPGLVSVTAHAA